MAKGSYDSRRAFCFDPVNDCGHTSVFPNLVCHEEQSLPVAPPVPHCCPLHCPTLMRFNAPQSQCLVFRKQG